MLQSRLHGNTKGVKLQVYRQKNQVYKRAKSRKPVERAFRLSVYRK